MIRYIDLFAGVGGFRYGIERCFSNKRKVQTEQTDAEHLAKPDKYNVEKSFFDCVYSNEWDKYASSVYKKHYGECDNRDIRTIKASEIPDHDLLCGGFPCQSFSVAGKRGGFNDTRGTLFFDIARILSEKRPRHLVLENVKGLLSHDSGKTFQTILGVLTDLGYCVEWQVLNSKDFGVPQNRERVYIVGHLGNECGQKVFPIRHTDENNTEQTEKLREQISNTLRTNYSNGKSNETYIGEGKEVRIRRLTPKECERLQGFPDNWTKYGHDGQKISDTQRYKMMGNAVTTNVITAIIRQSDWLEDAP